MTYQENVAVAATALKKGEDANWELARLTYENTSSEKGPVRDVGKVSMERWCADVREASGRRFSVDSGKLFKTIWERQLTEYGEPAHHTLSWTDAYRDVRGPTGWDRQKESGLTHTSPEAKIETAKKLLSDRKVADAVVADRDTSMQLHAAESRHTIQQGEIAHRKMLDMPGGRAMDKLTKTIDSLSASIGILAALQECTKALDTYMPDLVGDASVDRPLLRNTLRVHREALDRLDYFLVHGRSDLDGFLAGVLKEGKENG